MCSMKYALFVEVSGHSQVPFCREGTTEASRCLVWQVRQFIEGLAPGSVVADVGCGNGKYFMVRQDIAVLGSDRSSGLAQVAATRLAAGTGAAPGRPATSACQPVRVTAVSIASSVKLQAASGMQSVALI